MHQRENLSELQTLEIVGVFSELGCTKILKDALEV